MAPNRVTSQASAKGRDTPDHAEVPSSRSSQFEIGKSYRMWGGGIAKITAIKKNLLIGKTNIPYVRCWSLNGAFTDQPSPYTLIGKPIEGA